MSVVAGFRRLQIVYWAIAAAVIGVGTILAGGDEEANGWERLTNGHIVYWADDRGMPDILTNLYYLPATLSTEQAKAKLVEERKVTASESVIPLYINTWNEHAAVRFLWISAAVAIGVWIAGHVLAWVISGFISSAE